MLPKWVKKLGQKKSIVLLTVVTVILSVGISCLLHCLLNDKITISGVLIAAIIPGILAPLLGTVFFRAYFELDETKSKLARLSVTDELTQIYNRRYFIGRANYELSRAKRYGQTFSMLLLDLDDFKQINDLYGHPAGDAVLRMVADTCLRESREVDVLARYGGDEFALLIPNLGQSSASQYADRLRRLLGEMHTEYGGDRLQTTVSVGVVAWSPEIVDVEQLIYLMDKALYDAKHGGKNRTVVSGAELLEDTVHE